MQILQVCRHMIYQLNKLGSMRMCRHHTHAARGNRLCPRLYEELGSTISGGVNHIWNNSDLIPRNPNCLLVFSSSKIPSIPISTAALHEPQPIQICGISNCIPGLVVSIATVFVFFSSKGLRTKNLKFTACSASGSSSICVFLSITAMMIAYK